LGFNAFFFWHCFLVFRASSLPVSLLCAAAFYDFERGRGRTAEPGTGQGWNVGGSRLGLRLRPVYICLVPRLSSSLLGCTCRSCGSRGGDSFSPHGRASGRGVPWSWVVRSCDENEPSLYWEKGKLRRRGVGNRDENHLLMGGMLLYIITSGLLWCMDRSVAESNPPQTLGIHCTR